MKGERIDRSFTSDVFLDISLEQFKGRSVVNTLGNNESLPNGEITIWEEDTIYVFPTVASLFTVESSNVNDVLGGSGIEKVELNLLDADYNQFFEEVEMNGTSQVSILKLAIRCNGVKIIRADQTVDDTNRVNAGIVRVKEPGGNVLAHMRAGENGSDGTFFTVARGKIAVIYFPSATVSSGTECDLLILLRDGPGLPFVKRRIFSVFEGSIVTEINKPIKKLPEFGDLILNVDKLTGGPSPMISGGIQIILMNKL